MEEQAQVFSQPCAGFRKVILSTNIAESSITVPDIKYGMYINSAEDVITSSLCDFVSTVNSSVFPRGYCLVQIFLKFVGIVI
jgi:ATP-dependent RNA helicase TDRD9